MEDLFVWKITSSSIDSPALLESLEYNGTILPGTTTNLFLAQIYHFFYWGIENISIYLTGIQTQRLLEWSVNDPGSGLVLTPETGDPVIFSVDQGDKMDTPILLQREKLLAETPISFTVSLKAPSNIKQAEIMDFSLNLVYTKVGAS